MKTKLLFCATAALAVLTLAPAVTRAETPREIHQRMEQRVAQIDNLKVRGAVGEDNHGFLAARGPLSGEENGLMAAENQDRAAIYTIIAKQTGSTAEQVGRQRAQQIARNSQPGVWIQDENGTWRRK